ncbi:MAG: AAA family ATPase [Candidatus Chisholmbacteria bacterium]|nr:AAA family ATPase [Candidatus Chisholmbacteria bacterium]
MPTDSLVQEVEKLKKKLEAVTLPPELKDKVEEDVDRLTRVAVTASYTQEYDRVAHYVEWVVSLPWNKRSEDVLDLGKARAILDKNHYGMEEVKERVLEYLAVLKLRHYQKTEGSVARAPILCLVGLVGTGKTTFAYSLAEAVGRQLVRIPFGGMGSARDLRGQSRLHAETEPGYVIKGLRRAGTKNPVMLLDEIDRVAEEARADIMGVLVELLDPEQNFAFLDHYLDYPFDLSEVLFIATANNTTNVATAVMDRLEPISMPSYSDQEKMAIGKDYLLPQALQEAGLKPENLTIDEQLWPKIVRPLGYDAGIRTLQRTIQGITRKLAREVIEGKRQHLNITPENVKDYLPVY